MPPRIKADWLYTLLALAIIAVGFVAFWFPVPVGALFMAFGLTLLVGHSRVSAEAVLRIRQRRPRVHRVFVNLEARAPRSIRVQLERTNPDRPRWREGGA